MGESTHTHTRNQCYLFQSAHDLETVKVREVTANLLFGNLFGRSSGIPLFHNIGSLTDALDSLGTSTTGQIDLQGGQVHSTEGEDLALHTSQRTIDDCL